MHVNVLLIYLFPVYALHIFVFCATLFNLKTLITEGFEYVDL